MNHKRINKLAMVSEYTLSLHLQLLLYPFIYCTLFSKITQNTQMIPWQTIFDESAKHLGTNQHSSLFLPPLQPPHPPPPQPPDLSNISSPIFFVHPKSHFFPLPQFAEDLSLYFVKFQFFLESPSSCFCFKLSVILFCNTLLSRITRDSIKYLSSTCYFFVLHVIYYDHI